MVSQGPDLVQDGRPTNSLRGTNEKAPTIVGSKLSTCGHRHEDVRYFPT